MDNTQNWKMKEVWNPFHKQNFQIDFFFKIWTHEQQELTSIQIFTGFWSQNLAVKCVKLSAVKRI